MPLLNGDRSRGQRETGKQIRGERIGGKVPPSFFLDQFLIRISQLDLAVDPSFPYDASYSVMKGIEKAIAKAIYDYHLIEEGDRILIGASGGKDSTTLSWALARRLQWEGPCFTLQALRIRTDVPGGAMPKEAEQALEGLYAEWGVPLETVDVPVIGRLKPGKEMNCYWCATQRRTELMRYALAHGYNKIALGHHLDDILTTLLMNMVNKGELSTMIPKLIYRKFPVTVIRPLALVPEESIRRFASSQGWLNVTCSCAYGAEGKRKEFQRRLEVLTGGELDAKLRMFYSLSHVNQEYLP